MGQEVLGEWRKGADYTLFCDDKSGFVEIANYKKFESRTVEFKDNLITISEVNIYRDFNEFQCRKNCEKIYDPEKTIPSDHKGTWELLDNNQTLHLETAYEDEVCKILEFKNTLNMKLSCLPKRNPMANT